jgi:hypothetical protein
MRFRNFLGWVLVTCLYVAGCALWFFMMVPGIDLPPRPEASPPPLEAQVPGITVGLKR